MDRKTLDLLGKQKQLLQALKATGTPLIVVLLNGGQITTEPWQDGTAAVIEAWYPGQEGGRALADLLFDTGGASKGFGRLIYSFYKSQAVMPPHTSMAFEGAGRTYRYARDDARTLSFHFGDGLPGYTKFSYSAPVLRVDGVPSSSAEPCQNVSISVTVTNTGMRAGSEIVQVYVAGENTTAARVAPAHVRALSSFVRTRVLAAGESDRVELSVPPSALSVIVVEPPDRALAPGTLANTTRMLMTPRRFVLSVGGSQPRPAGVEWSSAGAGGTFSTESSARSVPLELPGFSGTTVLGLRLTLSGQAKPLAQCYGR